jgi:hypothetical protein
MSEIIVDENMKHLLLEKKWRISHFGYVVHSYRETGKVKTIRIHRVILGVTDPKVIIDHINGNKLDNRVQNLRIATTSQNGMNRKKTKLKTSSIYKGVSKCSDRNKWASMIKANGKRINLGRFNTESEAAEAYNKAALTYFGEFAKINEII